MKKKLLVLMSLIMILAGAFTFVSTQMVGAQEGPIEPTWTDPTCTNPNGSYTYAITPGFIYESSLNGSEFQEIVFTNIVAGDVIIVNALGRNEVEVDQWIHTFTTPNCLIDPPGIVVFTAPTCDKLGYYTITAVTGISYFIGEDEIAAGIYTVENGTSVVITAKADPGYYLPNEARFIEYSYTFTALTNCVTTVAASKPTKLPATSSDSTMVNIAILSAIAVVITILGLAVRSILIRKI